MVESFFTWVSSWFVNTLSWWQWLILLAVPPAITLLYFLKLKRRPLQVPSTYLWHKSIEDLHVNSIWQHLRRNLLLLLQLLLLLLLLLALLRPSWQGKKLTGDRFIFLIDNSASMQATDLRPSRLEEAKRQVGELIDQMKSGEAAMIVSFADTARVVQTFTDDRRRLHRSLESIHPTQRSTSLLEALKVASGSANPGYSAEEDGEFRVAEALPAELFIFSDGRFAPVAGFSLGNLKPVFVPIGESETANVGIVAFSVRRNDVNPEQFQAFARLKNFAAEAVQVRIDLFLDDLPEPIDAAELRIAAGEARGVTFDLRAAKPGELRLQAATGDDLAVDDRAWTVVQPPRRADVLLVTPGNEYLELALKTELVAERAEVQIKPIEFLKDKSYAAKAGAGEYDLVIYDRCQPQKMPPANTLFIRGLPPPETGWSAEPKAGPAQISDFEATHPLLHWMDLGNVILVEGTTVKPPPGGSVLAEADFAGADTGPVLAIAPRDRFEDAVLGFAIIDQRGETAKKYRNTNWPTLPSFPEFILNAVTYFGGSRDAVNSGSVRPGQPVTLKVGELQAGPRILTPGGEQFDLEGGTGRYDFTGTAELGVYRLYDVDKVESDAAPLRRFAVNLFDTAESDIRANQKLQIGWVAVEGQRGWEATRQDVWKVLVLLGLVVLLLEWYIYNRRMCL